MPVVFLTALNSGDDRIRGFRLGADDYVCKPFHFEELDLRVTRALARGEHVERLMRERIKACESSEPGPNASLVGNLGELGLPSLLTLFEMERKTGVLLLTRDGAAKLNNKQPTAGQIRLVDGRCIYARFEDVDALKNTECIQALLEWSSGRFEFVGKAIEQEAEIHMSTMGILMEAARLADEQNLVQ